MCNEKGYTYDCKIYYDKESVSPDSVTTSVAMKLMQPLFDWGRTLYVDNYYTSYDFAQKLANRKTYLVWILRKIITKEQSRKNYGKVKWLKWTAIQELL